MLYDEISKHYGVFKVRQAAIGFSFSSSPIQALLGTCKYCCDNTRNISKIRCASYYSRDGNSHNFHFFRDFTNRLRQAICRTNRKHFRDVFRQQALDGMQSDRQFD